MDFDAVFFIVVFVAAFLGVALVAYYYRKKL